MISVSPPLNNSVVNPSQLSSVCQQSSSSSHNTPRDNRCFNSKYSISKSNGFLLPVIPVPPTLKDSVINTTHMSSVSQHLSSSSQKTTHESQSSSILGWTSPDTKNTMHPPSTNNGGRNIYACMVDVSNLTPAK